MNRLAKLRKHASWVYFEEKKLWMITLRKNTFGDGVELLGGLTRLL